MMKQSLNFGEIILSFQITIDRHEDIESTLGKSKKRAIFRGAPTGLGYGGDDVTWKGPLKAGRNALV